MIPPFPQAARMTVLPLTFMGAILIAFAISGQRATSFTQILGMNGNEDPAVTRFREYLRIKSNFPNPDYDGCIAWLKQQAHVIGLDFHEVHFEKPDLFAVWLTWTGSDPSLKSILLNSHMDVVAVDYSKWDHDPFEAFKDENGYIYGRGAVDMKSATVATLEALRRLKLSGFQPLRTIHVSVLPDEEIGGNHGMKAFVKSPEFKSLNTGFDIDETSTSDSTEVMLIEFRQKSIWQFNFTARGMSAHGSNLPETTAGQKLQVVINKLFDYRATQFALSQEPNMTMANVTSLNLVRIGGGIGNNIIPDELWCSWDMRILLKPGWNFTDVENFLNKVAEDAGPGVSYQFIQKSMEIGVTIPDDSNVWWVELQKACKQMNMKCIPYTLNGATDGRYVRDVGIPVFGISGITNTTKMAHQDNERITERAFLEAIGRYGILIEGMTSVPGERHP